MSTTNPSLLGASATATLGLNADGTIGVVTSKADDFIGAVLAPMVGPFNGGASVSVGMGHTIGEVAKLGLAMYAENKLGLVNKILPV